MRYIDAKGAIHEIDIWWAPGPDGERPQ